MVSFKLRFGIVIFVLLLWAEPSLAVGFSCLNRNGQPVDWFLVYKLPSSSEFMYMDADDPSSFQQPIDKSLNDEDQPIALTLQQIYDNKDNMNAQYNMYSDQPPDGGTIPSCYAHAKGVAAKACQTGFWMVHTVPRFPKPNQYSWPSSGHTNGQTFLCLSVHNNQFTEIQNQLAITRPYFYYPKETTHPRSLFFREMGDKVNLAAITTLAGQQFDIFGKSHYFTEDIYSGLMAGTINDNLYTQSWRSGNVVKLPSSCNGMNTVENIKTINLPDSNDFGTNVDHSKWCVSAQLNWTCIADLNRVESQKFRGGGAVCINHPDVAEVFRSAVGDKEDC